jgi:hypothetical protein
VADGITDHVVPFQDSMNCVVGFTPDLPTATHEAVEVQDTPRSTPRTVLEAGATDQRVPFQDSASAVSGAPPWWVP